MTNDKELREMTNKELLIRAEGDRKLMRKDIEESKKKIDEMHEVIYGNGNVASGMSHRLIVVEQFHGAIRRVVWIAVGAAVVSGVGALIAAFT